MYQKILIADDEEQIVSLIKDALSDDGYEVVTAYNGKEAIKKSELNLDLIILDIMMPGIDGYEVCKYIRNQISCPILFLSAKQREIDKIKGLAIGGDDYIVKPFSVKELKARVKAHLRREGRKYLNSKKDYLRFRDISIDIEGRNIYFKNKPIHTTKREFDIIELLTLNQGQVFSKEQIYEKIWGYDGDGDTTNITEHVKNIRSKIKAAGNKEDYIKTVWGIGYKWEIIKC